TSPGLILNSSTGMIDLPSSTPGTYTISYTVGGACPDSKNIDIRINDQDPAGFFYSSSNYCPFDNNPRPIISGLVGGVFRSSSGLGLDSLSGSIDLIRSAPALYSITYTTAGACPNSSTQNVTVSKLDVSTFSYPSSAYCVNVPNPVPVISGITGGVFSSDIGLALNTVTGEIDLHNSTGGIYAVHYTTRGTCPSSSVDSVRIEDASFNLPSPNYCANGIDPTPVVTGLSGGLFSGSTGLALDPATGKISLGFSTPGNHTVSYTIGGSCVDTHSQPVEIVEADNAGFSYSKAAYCISEPDPVPQISVFNSGVFSSPTGLVLDSITGVPDLSASMPANHLVRYSTNGVCPNDAIVPLEVMGLDVSGFSYSKSAYCADEADPVPTISGTTGGVFSAASGISIDENTGQIDLSASLSGSYVINYRTSGNCPNSSNIALAINDLDDAGFSYGMPSFCPQGTDPSPVIAGVAGGSFSAPAGLSVDPLSGTIDLSASVRGTYMVNYITSGTCPQSSMEQVTIGDLIPPVASVRDIVLALDETGQASLQAEDVNYNSSDNCGLAGYSLNRTSFDCSDVGVNQVLFTATDQEGNTNTDTVQVVVEDNFGPSILPTSLEVFLGSSGLVSVDSSVLTVSDNCGNYTLVVSSNSQFDCEDLGRNILRVQASDRSNNISNQTVVVQVRDTIAPDIVCPNSLRIEVLRSQVPFGVQVDAPQVSDNCSAALSVSNSFNQTQDASGQYPLGMTSVQWTVQDQDGNIAQCAMSVELLETQADSAINSSKILYVNEHQLLSHQSRLIGQVNVPANYRLSVNALTLGMQLSESGLVEWIPNESHGPKMYTVQLHAISQGDDMILGTETLLVHVREINEAHSIVSVEDQTVDEHALLQFPIAVTDPDLPRQFFTYSIDPAYTHLGIQVNENTGLVSWTPGEAHGGNSYLTRFWVSDNANPTMTQFVDVTIHVRETLSNIAVDVIGSTEVYQTIGDSTALLAFIITDPDNRVLDPSVRIASSPAGVVDDQNFEFSLRSGRYVLELNLMNREFVGTVEVRVFVDDGLGEDQESQRTGNVSAVHELVYYLIFEGDALSLNIPNMFTPNGDGINDTWNILNLSFYTGVDVKVYNQHGVLVFSEENYSPQAEWDGTYEGEKVSSGPYFYIIEAGEREYRGVVNVVR
ncbi:MAG: gliding motility-associated C-terminal domain-containing protein, partial [Cytophagales bacterium]|nr:gliding motility-associated C-terminal domain-containing protein [Cytophagales bacterium]